MGWFVFCVVTTVMNIFPVGNIAHGVGTVLSVLVTATAIVLPRRRLLSSYPPSDSCSCSASGDPLWGVPVSICQKRGGYEEGKWGYGALRENRNDEAAHWLSEAVIYQPKLSVYWFDLGIAYQRLGNTPAAKAAYQKAVQLEPNKSEYSDSLKCLTEP